VGVYYAYGAYNPIKQPVIGVAFALGILDLVFSICSAMVAWSVFGYLYANLDPAAFQNTSVGFAFIAMPKIATYMQDGDTWLILFFL
jgi:SNF family Na+-dependent transporter